MHCMSVFYAYHSYGACGAMPSKEVEIEESVVVYRLYCIIYNYARI